MQEETPAKFHCEYQRKLNSDLKRKVGGDMEMSNS